MIQFQSYYFSFLQLFFASSLTSFAHKPSLPLPLLPSLFSPPPSSVCSPHTCPGSRLEDQEPVCKVHRLGMEEYRTLLAWVQGSHLLPPSQPHLPWFLLS